uniref:Uncharacterized protein n=1 Tax=Cannabis sativa TaxID=3483 RepID=A0A803PRP1_CANSA
MVLVVLLESSLSSLSESMVRTRRGLPPQSPTASSHSVLGSRSNSDSSMLDDTTVPVVLSSDQDWTCTTNLVVRLVVHDQPPLSDQDLKPLPSIHKDSAGAFYSQLSIGAPPVTAGGFSLCDLGYVTKQANRANINNAPPIHDASHRPTHFRNEYNPYFVSLSEHPCLILVIPPLSKNNF